MNIKLTGALDVRDGYGHITQELGLALDEMGHTVFIDPIKEWYSDQELLPRTRILTTHRIHPKYVDYEMIIFHVNKVFGRVCKNSGILTMWEANNLPTRWITGLNKGPTNHVLAPSEFVKQMFYDSGVTKRIEMFPLGIRKDKYPLEKRTFPNNRTFKFLSLAKMEPRKNSDFLIDAFIGAFGRNHDVQLVIKTRQGFLPSKSAGKIRKANNIVVIDKTMEEKELIDLYYSCDAFVYFSRGEGFSFPPRNAIAAGMPVIVTGWSALNEIPGAVKVPPKGFSPMHPIGLSFGEENKCLMANLSLEDASKSMRDVYENYDKFAELVATKRDEMLDWTDVSKNLIRIASQ